MVSSVGHQYQLSHLFDNRESLVESRKIFSFDTAELNFFETVQQTEQFKLQFTDPVVAIMLKGKKVMHLNKVEPFAFLPGQSVILPSSETMVIDFPEASELTPTRCLALTLSPNLIAQTLDSLNEGQARMEDDDWQIDYRQFFLTNDDSLNALVQKLMYLFVENVYGKRVLTSHALQELIVRIMQTQARRIFLEKNITSNNRTSYLVRYIRNNLQKDLSVDELASVSCMSRPHFFRVFKNQFGMTPIDFVNRERIRYAKKLLLQTKDMAEACYGAGFNNLSYFHRVFKKLEKVTPATWFQRHTD